MIRSFNGKTPRIHPGAFISEAAYVVGDVEIGENSSVWPGAVIRGDYASIRIGKCTHVQDNCVIHADSALVIGDNVNIGHSVVVHCIKIGNNCLLGMHATLLDDVEVGNFCMIGAGAVLMQGMKVPDRSFVVGLPAQVKSQISETQAQRLGRGTVGYTQKAQQFKSQGL